MTRAELREQFKAGCTRLGELELIARQLRQAHAKQLKPIEAEHALVLEAIDKLNAALGLTDEPTPAPAAAAAVTKPDHTERDE